MKISDLETPAALLDLDILKKNMDTIEQIIAPYPVKLRPHFKTCKSIQIAKMQLEAGAVGITTSKLAEAQVLVDAGFPNVLIANQIIQKSKLKRLASLALKSHIIVCVDQAQNIYDLSEAATKAGAEIFVYIEYDIGMHRCGVSTYEDFYALAKLITELPSITFSGIQAYAGHLSHEADLNLVQQKVLEYEERLKGLKKYLEERGIPVKDISGASTNTSRYKAGHGVYTELQPGSYVFVDQAYRPCHLPYEQSLFIVATVISKSTDRIILDVGAKGLGMDQVFPCVVGHEEDDYILSEEHFAVQNSKGIPYTEKIGDKVLLIPGHCCTTINLYPELYVKKGEDITTVWNVEGSLKSV